MDETRDPAAIAKAIMKGPGKLYGDAEIKLATAFASGDESAKRFWQAVFGEFSRLMEDHARMDDASWYVFQEARRYADGAVPVVGAEGAAERNKADDGAP
jgi:hypothetical protein